MINRKGKSFYFCWFFFITFVIFLYGPTFTIVLLSFQGPEGGLTFPMNGLSVSKRHCLESRVKPEKRHKIVTLRLLSSPYKPSVLRLETCFTLMQTKIGFPHLKSLDVGLFISLVDTRGGLHDVYFH